MASRTALPTDLHPPPRAWAIDLPAGSSVLEWIPHALAAADRIARKPTCHQIGFSAEVTNQKLLNILNSKKPDHLLGIIQGRSRQLSIEREAVTARAWITRAKPLKSMEAQAPTDNTLQISTLNFHESVDPAITRFWFYQKSYCMHCSTYTPLWSLDNISFLH